MMVRWVCAAALALLLPLAAGAQERSQSRAFYVFGNSLVHHLGEQEHANMPHWLAELARADGGNLALDGQWGFLRNFADDMPPQPNWTIPGVTGRWDAGRGAFGDAGFDGVLITPANFLQYQAPDRPYDGDNPTGESPLDATLRIVDWLQGRVPGTPIWIYEGWAEMNAISRGFPPSDRALRRYYDHLGGEYAAWYDTLVMQVKEARPEVDARLLPVSRVLGQLLARDGILGDLPADALFVDADPHGTPSLYFLAAMISYVVLYHAPPPAGYRPPDTLLPEIVDRYPEIAARIVEAVAPYRRAAADAGAPGGPAADPAPLPRRAAVELPPRGARPESIPALGMGLNGISDWSTQQPFIDVMKTAREWVGHLPGQWGGVTAEELRAEGVLDDNGWPRRIPERTERLEALMLTDQPEDALSLRGKYLVFWEGKGDLDITGRARRVYRESNRAEFHYEPGEGSVGISISATDADDPIRNIRVIREDLLPLHEAGAIFNPDWIDRIHDLRQVRFMDWMMTNGSPVQGWADRPRLTDYTWSAWGVPLEAMIALANLVGADPWFTLPHMADDDYVRRFAETVKADLDPRLKAHVEYSNEVWNFVFPQAGWAASRSEELWGPSETGWMQFYGLRAAQVMDIWTEVFGDEADSRLVRIVATHTGWPGLEDSILTAPLAYLRLDHSPADSFDAYAVAGYFGYELGGEDMAPRIDDWLARSEAQAEREGEAKGLRRVALREEVREHRFDAAILPVAMALQDGSLRELTEEIFPYHAGAAEAAGLRLLMYEGGTHASAQMERVNDERLTAFFEVFNYSPEMAKLYEQLLTGWTAAGGTLFNAFVDVAPASKWGSWGALRHLDDTNPRWDMLMAYNATAPTDWEDRDPGAFADGVTRRGDASANRLTGTPEEDILLGLGGDDTLIGGGGGDYLSGGPGDDLAILDGRRADYAFAREGNHLIATGPAGRVTLTDVERLEFTETPGERLATAGL